MLWVWFMPRNPQKASPADQNNPEDREPQARQDAFDPDDRKGAEPTQRVGRRPDDDETSAERISRKPPAEAEEAELAEDDIEEIDLDQLEDGDGPDA
ncbi:MAG: hypothetical protein H0X17_01170 [Deltaproteobacteria bacterium]|nr:hypothetical protein [Deltaproteobacteria bacterium]